MNGDALSANLSGAEIQNKFIGSKMKYRSSGNRVGTITFKRNGRLNWRSGIGATGDGEWRIEGDKLCSVFNPTDNWRGAPWRCRGVRETNIGFRYGSFTYTK